MSKQNNKYQITFLISQSFCQIYSNKFYELFESNKSLFLIFVFLIGASVKTPNFDISNKNLYQKLDMIENLTKVVNFKKFEKKFKIFFQELKNLYSNQNNKEIFKIELKKIDMTRDLKPVIDLYYLHKSFIKKKVLIEKKTSRKNSMIENKSEKQLLRKRSEMSFEIQKKSDK